MKLVRAFTLVELLVVIAVIAVLMGILMPALHKSRLLALRMKCLSNMRNMEVAHWMYMTDWDGSLVDVGLAHAGAHAEEKVAWINTLQPYYKNKLLYRSPVDKSPHWPVDEGGQGVPVPPTTDQFRRTSYGINNYLTTTAPERPYRKLSEIRRASAPSIFLSWLLRAGSPARTIPTLKRGMCRASRILPQSRRPGRFRQTPMAANPNPGTRGPTTDSSTDTPKPECSGTSIRAGSATALTRKWHIERLS